MAISIYDSIIPSYLQILEGVSGVLAKGLAHCEAQGIDPQEMVEASLHPDMLPLRFQIISVAHHSLGALRGMQEGVFTPPPSMPDLDYSGMQALLDNAHAELKAATVEAVNALEEGSLVFKLSSMEMPFTVENFITSFSLPNVYFHATTAYDILRMKGVPLGKMDYLGPMRIG